VDALAADNALMELLSVHKSPFPPAAPLVANLERVDEAAILEKAKEAALQGISHFDRRARREARAQAEDAAAREVIAEHARQSQTRDLQQGELDSAWSSLISNDPTAVIAQLEAAFEDNDMPAAALDVQEDRLVVAMSLPPRAYLVPERKAAETPSGKPTVHKRTKTEQNSLYLAVLASNVIATAKEAFAVAPGIQYLTVLAVVKDDARELIEPLFVGSFRRTALEGLDFSTTDVLDAAFSRALIQQTGRTGQLKTLDLSDEDELREVIQQLAGQLGYGPGAEGSATSFTRSSRPGVPRSTTRAEEEGRMRNAEDVPIVRDNVSFMTLERARLTAMQDANGQSNDEGRLAGAMVVVKLSELQVEELEGLMDEAQQLPAYDARIDEFREWLEIWLETAQGHLSEWADYQRGLVQQIGDEQAQTIADTLATPRVQAVLESIKDALREQLRALGATPLDEVETNDAAVSDFSAGEDTKVCPDCAEEVKAAARVCRFCRYRFDGGAAERASP